MPRGPQGQKRPADVIGCAVMVARIATGEIEDLRVSEGKQKGGFVGGPARAAKLTSKERSEIAKKAAKARWNNHKLQ